MELVERYIEMQAINRISKLVQEIYLHEVIDGYERDPEPLYAVDHLYYWRAIPEDLYNKLNDLLRKNEEEYLYYIYIELINIKANFQEER